jgi:hypothetical protein
MTIQSDYEKIDAGCRAADATLLAAMRAARAHARGDARGLSEKK